jgi:hypothetical protein
MGEDWKMRQNILNGKWFIKFRQVEDEITPESAGKIIEEASDGWFYVEVFGKGWNVIERRVVAIGDLASCRFYPTEIAFRDDWCSKPLLKRRENAS